jgi:type II secretory pathway pseudopilin PulG
METEKLRKISLPTHFKIGDRWQVKKQQNKYIVVDTVAGGEDKALNQRESWYLQALYTAQQHDENAWISLEDLAGLVINRGCSIETNTHNQYISKLRKTFSTDLIANQARNKLTDTPSRYRLTQKIAPINDAHFIAIAEIEIPCFPEEMQPVRPKHNATPYFLPNNLAYYLALLVVSLVASWLLVHAGGHHCVTEWNISSLTTNASTTTEPCYVIYPEIKSSAQTAALYTSSRVQVDKGGQSLAVPQNSNLIYINVVYPDSTQSRYILAPAPSSQIKPPRSQDTVKAYNDPQLLSFSLRTTAK